MHKLKVTLKQHTPLIHFQHDQEGATLRASEVKPKLDKFIIQKLTDEQKTQGRREGWLKEKDGKSWLDYRVKIVAEGNEIQNFWMNAKRPYRDSDERKDNNRRKTKEIVENGKIINSPDRNKRYVIKENNQEYFAKVRKEDHKVIYDLGTYPCFFANMDSDITDNDEYKKMSYTEELISLSIITKYLNLKTIMDDSKLLCSFFLNHNFGTRQSKGFGSFYIDETDCHYIKPTSQYFFKLPVKGEYYDDDYKTLFEQIELFTKSIRAGLNVKSGRDTVFYFKSLAFMYCKDKLKSKWDKKCVKKNFYFQDLRNQQQSYQNDNEHEVLFFDEGDGYDIRDMLGFSTNEEWQSYRDSIEKKVALIVDNQCSYPQRDAVLPVERMRSPMLIKPICVNDNEGNISYEIFLVLQDNLVGMNLFKTQKKICIFSRNKRDERNLTLRFMINIPKDFTMENYFSYIFNELDFDISTHVEEQYQTRKEYKILENIYRQIKENLQ